MGIFDQWYDWWRLGVLVVSFACVVILVHRFVVYRKEWGEQPRDGWFALLMWSIASIAMQVESVAFNLPLRYRLVFVTAAALITLKLLTKKNNWYDYEGKNVH